MNTTQIKEQLKQGLKIAVKSKDNRIVEVENDLYIFNCLTGNKVTLESFKGWEQNIFTLNN